jgi:hypothetical protein
VGGGGAALNGSRYACRKAAVQQMHVHVRGVPAAGGHRAQASCVSSVGAALH